MNNYFLKSLWKLLVVTLLKISYLHWFLFFFFFFSKTVDGASGDGNTQREGGLHEQAQESEDSTAECPALVVYMVDPFTYSQEWDHLNRLAMIGLLHCYQELVKTLPEQMQNHVSLQVCCCLFLYTHSPPFPPIQFHWLWFLIKLNWKILLFWILFLVLWSWLCLIHGPLLRHSHNLSWSSLLWRSNIPS